MDWRDRFRAGVVKSAVRARSNPRRGVAITDRDGNDEAYAWDVEAGTLQRLTAEGNAVLEAAITPDGRSIIYLRDRTGSEFGHLHSVPFEGGKPVDLTPDLDEYTAYLVKAHGGVVTAITAFSEGQRLLCVRNGESSVWPQEAIVASAHTADDGSFIAIGEAMEGLYGRTVVRSLIDGSEAARLDMSVPGALHGGRIAVAVHRDGWLRPAIWAPGRDPELLDVDIPGDVMPTDWSEGGSRILLLQTYRSQGGLFIYDVPSRTTTRLSTPVGAPAVWAIPELVGEAAASVVWSDARTPWSAIEVDERASRVLLRASERESYPARDWQEVSFGSTGGARVHAWLLTPAGEKPWPTILYSHGGPTSVASPTFSPLCQAWVDNGYALLSVNYRGSTTFGDDYREALTGNVGGVDVDDLVAAHGWLIESGIAQPDGVILNGYSYGGYLTLQCMGTHPELWAAGIAGAPIADWILAGEDQNSVLDAYDLALFGTDRTEGHDARVKASPRTYIERFAAPLLISTPENDTRTPIRPTRLFVEEMRAAGKEVQLEILSGGHAGVGAEQWIRMMESWFEFANRVAPAPVR